jgi:hypothetical protein
MQYVLAFVAGFLSTLVFHQGLLAAFRAAGATEETPYSLKRTAPLGVPEVLSLAAWGGVWGVLLWLGLRAVGGGWPYWALAVVAGAIGPTLVALLVVFPLKGRPQAAGGLATLVGGALVLNGAWGFGVALLMKLFDAAGLTR